MKTFDDLKKDWQGQSQPEVPKDGPNRIIEKMTFIKKGQRITNIILSITALVLIGFFFYVAAYNYRTVTMGLLLMVGALTVRIVLEAISIRNIKRMDVTEDAVVFRQRLLSYYKQRQKVHFWVTPLVILAYCIGFVMLLPSFKVSLSAGFYTYIVVSSMVLLLVLGLFIIKQIRKELSLLRELKD